MALAPNLYNVCSAISDCGTYGAQVTCLINLSQGATGCVEIQIYDKNLNRADLSQFNVIQILVTDTGNNVVAIFSEPALIGNYFDRPLEILTDGLVKGCFTSEMTSNAMTGRLSAEIKMIKEASTGEIEDVIIIRCIQIGTIRQSAFSLGFTENGTVIGPGTGGGTSGSGTAGTSGTSGTSGTGISGTSGTSGTSGFGTNGTSGTSGVSGTSGTSGFGTNGTSGTSGIGTNGTSGSSGVSGTGGFLADWELNNSISVGANEQLTFSGDYVLENSEMLIEASDVEIEYSSNKYFKKIGKLFIGGNLLIKDSLLENNGLISVGGQVVMMGNSQIIGTGTII